MVHGLHVWFWGMCHQSPQSSHEEVDYMHTFHRFSRLLAGIVDRLLTDPPTLQRLSLLALLSRARQIRSKYDSKGSRYTMVYYLIFCIRFLDGWEIMSGCPPRFAWEGWLGIRKHDPSVQQLHQLGPPCTLSAPAKPDNSPWSKNVSHWQWPGYNEVSFRAYINRDILYSWCHDVQRKIIQQIHT